jgi:plasmid stability protein
MPANLSVKNIPDDLVAKLLSRAKHSHRSLQGELMTILEEAIGPSKMSLDEVRQRAKQLGIQTGDEATA